MMNANELRPGNYFKTTLSRDRGEAFVVVKVDAESNQVSCGGIYWYHMENVRPVRLTEEWLKRMGFEYDMELGNYHTPTCTDKAGIYIENSDDKFTFETYHSYLEIAYVHQLQNLYFALTGNELEIK